MLKIPLFSLRFALICALLLLLFTEIQSKKSFNVANQTRETIVSFLHHQKDQQLFYWICIDVETESNSFLDAVNSLASSVRLVKESIKTYKQKNPSAKDQAPIMIFNETQESTKTILKAFESYELQLDELEIIFRRNFILNQNIIIRVENDPKNMGKFVDYLQSNVLTGNSHMNLKWIEQKSINKYQAQWGQISTQNSEPTQKSQSLTETEQFTNKITKTAQQYCKSLQMQLAEILSKKQMSYKDFLSKHREATSNEQDIENSQEMDFFDAWNQLYEQDSYELVDRIFQVQAKCTGNGSGKRRNDESSSLKDRKQKTEGREEKKPNTSDETRRKKTMEKIVSF